MNKALAPMIMALLCVSTFAIFRPQIKAFSIPADIVYSVPITITNAQPSPTAFPFQQMIQVDSAYYSQYEASNLQNVEFFYDNETVIPSWLESGNSNTTTNTIYWLNLETIPADSSITIYMGFASPSVNLFNNETTGEAPQISTTYGEYDDGAEVFTSYWNFAGTTIPSDWSSTIGPGANLTVNNGLIYQSPGYANGGTSIETIESYNPENQTTDALTQSNYLSGGQGAYHYGFENTQASITGGDYAVWTGPWCYEALSPTTPLNTNWNVLSSWASTTEGYASLNYNAASLSSDQGFSASTSSHLGFWWTGIDLQTTQLQWARVRVYPPNGVMPSVALPLSLTVSSPTPTIYNTASIPVQLTSQGASSVFYNVLNGSSWVCASNQTYSSPTQMTGFSNGTYVFYAWASNSTTTITQTVSFTVDIEPASSFSIFWITDTQHLSSADPQKFNDLTNWIVER